MASIIGPDGSVQVVDPSGAALKQNRAADLCVSGVSPANTALTVTLPAAGSNLFHHITRLEVHRAASLALVGSAILTVTTTNLPGGLAYSIGNAIAIGTLVKDLDITFVNTLKSSVANTATTFVLPAAGLNVIWRVNVYYFTSKN